MYRFFGEGEVKAVSGDGKRKITICEFDPKKGTFETGDRTAINILEGLGYDFENLDPAMIPGGNRKNLPAFQKPNIRMKRRELISYAGRYGIHILDRQITKSQILAAINQVPSVRCRERYICNIKDLQAIGA